MLTAIKGKIAIGTVIVGDCNTSLTQWTDHPDRKLINETQALNDTLNKMYLIDIIRQFHPKQQNTLSSQVLMEHSPG